LHQHIFKLFAFPNLLTLSVSVEGHARNGSSALN